MADSLLRVEGLAKGYQRGGGVVQALDGVDLELAPGEALALVGASGSGKSTLTRCALRLEPVDAGSIFLNGRDWTRARPRELQAFWKQAQLVFQAPQAAFDPLWRVGAAVEEPLRYLRPELGSKARAEVVSELFEKVELDPALATRFPHELSGGQLQRVSIARALAPRPRLLVADEPTSALDTMTQRQVLKLLGDLRRQEGLALLWVTHDLALLPDICDRVAVMQSGRIVEQLAVSELAQAKHPHTCELREAADIGCSRR
ncbi:MAG: ABC transporter ATP-binding protein [Deltaproteobacteria bacterium]|nr:ABC transporter ATP-binding protein [Deltaproteobacteria bacterium]